MAGTTPKTAPWLPSQPSQNAHTDYDWELYNVEEDFSQATNLAARFPDKLQELKDRFLVEATKYNVLPLDDSNIERFDVSNRPSLTHGRTTFTYRAGMTRIPEGSAPDLKNRSWQITADLTVPKTGADGMIFTQGGRFNGIGFYVHGGKPVFLYNFLNMERTRVAAKDALKPGKHTVVVKFDFLGKHEEAFNGNSLRMYADRRWVNPLDNVTPPGPNTTLDLSWKNVAGGGSQPRRPYDEMTMPATGCLFWDKRSEMRALNPGSRFCIPHPGFRLMKYSQYLYKRRWESCL